jgi:excisionase family DNA binding protein
MSTTANHRESVCIAVPVSEVARILGISVRHVWTLLAQERLPRPIRLGRSVRWNIEELRAWLAAGAPDLATWEEVREQTASGRGEGPGEAS